MLNRDNHNNNKRGIKDSAFAAGTLKQQLPKAALAILTYGARIKDIIAWNAA